MHNSVELFVAKELICSICQTIPRSPNEITLTMLHIKCVACAFCWLLMRMRHTFGQYIVSVDQCTGLHLISFGFAHTLNYILCGIVKRFFARLFYIVPLIHP